MSGVHDAPRATPAPDEDFRVYYRPRNLSLGTHPHDADHNCDDVVVSYRPPPRVPAPTAPTEPPTATTATRHLAKQNKRYGDQHATEKQAMDGSLGTARTEATSPPPQVSESATASETAAQAQHARTPEPRHEDQLDGATGQAGEGEAEGEEGSHATTRESERQPDDVAAAAAAPQKAAGVRRAAKRKTRAAVVDALKAATLVHDGAEGQRAHDDDEATEGTARKKASGAAKLDANRPVATEHTTMKEKDKKKEEKSAGAEGSNKARAEEAVLEVTLAEAERMYRQAKEHLDLCQGAGAYTRRDEDEEEMARFWQDHVLQRKPGSLYVSGSPGTGKTLTLSRVIERMKKWERKHRGDAPGCIVVELNGMQARAEQIEEAIIAAIAGAPGRRLEDLLTDPRRPHMTVVVLDELDQLIMAKQADILYKLFEITALPRSSLVFIGVANALRLKESLPLLQTAKYGDVKQMTFESYSAAQLLGILKGRQAKMDCRLFDDAALQLCASQAAKMSGDARKALHLATLAVEVALKDLPGNWGSQARRGLPRVSVQQMFQAMAGALGQVSKRVAQIRGLPTLQQLLLCCLVVARAQLATRVSGPLPWKTVFDTYKAVCTRDGFGAVTPSEFSDMCAALEGHALITTTKGKGKGSQQGLLLQVSDSELRSAVQPTRSLARVLPDAA